MKSKIKVSDSMPYLVDGCKLIGENGEEINKGAYYTLCRCGHSRHKPDCDGSHIKENFVGSCTCRNNRPEKAYKSNEIIVYFDPYLCRHAEECIKGSPDVFKKDERPWINLTDFNYNNLINTIKKCPSGALSYSVNGKRYINKHKENTVELEKNGPMNIKGEISVLDNNNENLYSDTNNHFSLCRCGYSGKKPFCDGIHNSKGFIS